MTLENPVYYSGHAPLRTPGRGWGEWGGEGETFPPFTKGVHRAPVLDATRCPAEPVMAQCPPRVLPGPLSEATQPSSIVARADLEQPLPLRQPGRERAGSEAVEKRPLCGRRTHPLSEKTPQCLGWLVLIAAFGERSCSGKGEAVSRLWARGRTPRPEAPAKVSTQRPAAPLPSPGCSPSPGGSWLFPVKGKPAAPGWVRLCRGAP